MQHNIVDNIVYEMHHNIVDNIVYEVHHNMVDNIVYEVHHNIVDGRYTSLKHKANLNFYGINLVLRVFSLRSPLAGENWSERRVKILGTRL